MVPGVNFSEILIIGVVALIVIGPRDLPKLARMVAGYVKQARGLARDFQKSFDDMGRALEIDELRKEVEALKRADPLKDVTKEIQALERDIKTAERKMTAPVARPTPIARPSTPTLVSSTPAAPVTHSAVGIAPAIAPAITPAPSPADAAPTPPPTIEPPAAEQAAPREDRKLSGA